LTAFSALGPPGKACPPSFLFRRIFWPKKPKTSKVCETLFGPRLEPRRDRRPVVQRRLQGRRIIRGAIADGGKGAGKGAAIGGVLGAGGGTLYGLNENKRHDERYREAYGNCMRSRGYSG